MADRYGFYGYFVICAGLLALFAWQQKAVPEHKRSVHVNMPGAAGPVMADLDPRNDSGVLKPFDEVEAQAYADELEREAEETAATVQDQV